MPVAPSNLKGYALGNFVKNKKLRFLVLLNIVSSSFITYQIFVFVKYYVISPFILRKQLGPCGLTIYDFMHS